MIINLAYLVSLSQWVYSIETDTGMDTVSRCLKTTQMQRIINTPGLLLDMQIKLQVNIYPITWAVLYISFCEFSSKFYSTFQLYRSCGKDQLNSLKN